MNKKYKISIVAIIAMTSSPAFAAGWLTDKVAAAGDFASNWARSDQVATPPNQMEPPAIAASGPAGNDCNKSLQAAMDVKAKEDAKAIDEIKPSAKSIADMPCFDKYKNFSLTSALGVPDLSGIVDQLKGQACSYADQQVSDATAPVNQSVWMPGGTRVNTGVVFGSAATTPVAAPAVKSTGGFQMPSIFK